MYHNNNAFLDFVTLPWKSLFAYMLFHVKVEKLKALGYFPLLLWGKYRPQNKKWVAQFQCPFELPVVVHAVLEKIMWLFEGLLEGRSHRNISTFLTL